MLAGVVALTASGIDGALLPVAFATAEAVLFVILAIYCARAIGYAPPSRLGPWLTRHRAFGFKAFLNGLLLDSNTKVDIVVLGYFASDAIVGVYAFAANVAEGLAQIPVVVQAVLTPRVSQLLHMRDSVVLRSLMRRSALLSVPFLLLMGTTLVALYGPAATWLTGDETYAAGWMYLAVLTAGVTLSAGHVPFALMPNQAGRPDVQLILLGALFASNLILNLMLVPWFGPIGAAVGTALASMSVVIYLAIIVQRVLGFSIWPFSQR